MTSKHNRPTHITSRRQFIKASLTTGAVASTSSLLAGCGDGSDSNNQMSQNNTSNSEPHLIINNWAGVNDLGYSGDNPYLHGVASGDPLPDRVILWTRISIPTNNTLSGANRLPVGYRVSRTPEFNDADIVQQGDLVCYAENDYTVKVDAKLSEAGTHYYYRFEALGYYSPIGRTKTAPALDSSPDSVRFAVCSCANYGIGYFNAYAIMAQQDIDAVLHLGDYIYEISNSTNNTLALIAGGANRPHEPAEETVTLEDYRLRYGQYHTDPDLQECHRQHPFVCVWDDHELADNTYATGAAAHAEDGSEGTFQSRRMAAVRAYHEWLPIRSESSTFDDQIKIYRRLPYGKMVNLLMLDTRFLARDKPDSDEDVQIDPTRTMIGEAQWDWIQTQLLDGQDKNTIWQVLGQQVIMSPTSLSYKDNWDGYRESQSNLFNFLETNNLTNTVVFTGDCHMAISFDVCQRDAIANDTYQPENSTAVLGVEFTTPGVTSISYRAYPTSNPLPNLRYGNADQLAFTKRGFLLTSFYADQCQTQYCLLNTVAQRSLEYFIDANLASEPNNPYLRNIDEANIRQPIVIVNSNAQTDSLNVAQTGGRIE